MISVIIIMIIAMLALFVALIFAAMAAIEVRKLSCTDDKSKAYNAAVNASISLAVSFGAMAIVLSLYIGRIPIYEKIGEWLGQKTTKGKWKTSPQKSEPGGAEQLPTKPRNPNITFLTAEK